MNVSEIVNWAQLSIWVLTIILYLYRHGIPMEKIKSLISDRVIAGFIILGVIVSCYSMYLHFYKPNIEKPNTVMVGSYDYHLWPSGKNVPDETIRGRSYQNETVEIDGKIFDHCSFLNVSFFYHGLAPSTFVGCKIVGDIILKTDNQSVSGYMRLDSFFSSHPDVKSFAHFERDESGQTHPLGEELIRTPAKGK